MSNPTKIVLVLAAITMTGSAMAQPAGAIAPPTAPAPAAAPAVATVAPFTSPEIEKIGKALIGSWKSKSSMAEGSDPSKQTEVVLNIAHVNVGGMTDALYVEQSRANQMNRPDRESIFQIYKSGDKFKIRTFEFRRQPGQGSSTTGTWAVPELFPNFTAAELVGTMDLVVSGNEGGYVAKSTHAYATGINNATEMTSEFTFGPAGLKTMDQGMDASGKVVWTAAAEFAKFTPEVTVNRMPSGLVTIDYVKGNGEPIVAGDSYTVEYEGWLANGYKFDSSREKGQPLTVRPAMAVIQGWTEGVMGTSKGTVRRILVPGNLAYVGMRRGMIPSDAPLYFEIEVVNVEKSTAPVKALPPAKTDGHEGHDHKDDVKPTGK